MSLFNIMVMYMVLGTVWSILALRVFYVKRKLYLEQRLFDMLTILINCLLFPFLVVSRRFIYIVKIETKEVINDGEDCIIENGFGIILEPLLEISMKK